MLIFEHPMETSLDVVINYILKLIIDQRMLEMPSLLVRIKINKTKPFVK